jgi:hypothetical protein
MSNDEAAGYIRGGAGVVDTRRLFRVLFDSLRHRGVPVNVTVTSCLGILSGTGITVTSFQCRGSFDLAGRSYNAVIDGSSVNHAVGDVVKAIADPKHPTSVSTPSSVVGAHSSWRAFIGPAILFLVLVLVIVGGVWSSRRSSARRRRAGAAPDVVAATADANPPASVSTKGSLAQAGSLAPIAAAGVVLALLIAGAVWWSRRNSAQRAPDGTALG